MQETAQPRRWFATLLGSMVVPGCADSYPSSLLQNHTRTVVLRWKWTAQEGDVSGCYGDSCDVLRFNEVCKHCREVQPADSRLFDERQADRCYHHDDVASASIPDDASRACLRIDGIEDYPRILPKTLLFQERTSFIPTCCRSLPPFALNTLSLKQGSIDTGRRGCGRLSLNKHGLECEQQQSKEKLYVSSWTDVPCARRILDRRHASSRSSKFTPLAPTSCMKCRAWRLGGLTVASLAPTSWFT